MTIMKVNGRDVSEFFDVRQWNVEMAHGEVRNESSWEDGCVIPILIPGHFGMKKIKISVMAKGEDRDSIWEKAGRFIAEFKNPAVLELDDFYHKFKVVLTNASQVESSMRRFHKATLELQGYEYGDVQNIEIPIMQDGTLIGIPNDGTMESLFSVKVTESRQYEYTNSVTISEHVEENGSEHLTPIMKFNFSGVIESISFNAETGEVLYRNVSEEVYKTAPLSLCEVYHIPSIPPGGMKLHVSVDGNNAGGTVTVEHTPMYL